MCAQALLGHRGDVLAIDEDAPALQVVQAQQQADQGRLAGAGGAHQADLLAGAHLEVEPADHPAGLAVVEVDVLETHRASADPQGLGVRAVEHLARLDDGAHAVLHGADVLEDAVDHPHDPFGHVVDADHQAQGQGDGAGADLRLTPQPQRQGAGAGDQQAIEAGDAEFQGGDGAGLPAYPVEQALHGLAGVAFLLLAVGEQLEGGDVAVAVDHPAHQLRARRRGRGRARLDARHEVAQQQAVAENPQTQRQYQAQVGFGEQVQRAAGIHQHVPQGVDHLHGRVAQGRAGLHDALGDAPGEVVLEEVQALPEHVAVVLPAHQVGQARGDRLIGQQIMQAEHQGTDQQHHRQHPQQLALVAVEEVAARGGLGHVDQLAEEVEQRHLDQGGEEADHQHGEQQRPGLDQVVGVEGQDALGRHHVRAGPEHVEQGFEAAKQHSGRPAIAMGE